ncbi:unnamed protein product [Soboliphyme baturini]|uniref:VWFA domain-containing protein n=1 Tax=Soboliphyme baturini TaxID=241478 RepID=A0A183I9E3_9BILA|nr:unnamed protein product [Soboliphyme baturini]
MADVIFILDASDSVKKAFPEQVKLVADIIDDLKVAPNAQRVAAIEYSSENLQKILFPFDKYMTSAAVKGAVESKCIFLNLTVIIFEYEAKSSHRWLYTGIKS